MKRVRRKKVICETLSDGIEVSFDVDDLVKENKLQYFSSQDVVKILSSEYQNISEDNSNQRTNFKYFYFIAIAFITCLLTSNLAATKLFALGNITLPGGIFIFPLLYVLNDTLTEVYGFTSSRKVIWTALLCNLFASVILFLVCYLPPSPNWHNQKEFTEIFLMSPVILVASVSSYLVGEGLNAIVMSFLKCKLDGKYFATRAIISTSAGAFLETLIFVLIAFGDYLPFAAMMKMVSIMSIIKVVYEICVMPFTIRFVTFLKKEENSDVYEMPSIRKMMPFT